MKNKRLIIAIVTSMLVLTGCGEKNSEEEHQEPEVHNHTFSSEFEKDETNHWHKATCEHTDLTKDLQKHTFGADNVCDVCGYVKEIEEEPHVHTFSEFYLKDETNHWKAATCEHTELTKDLEEHKYGDDNVCDVCGYVKETEEEPHEHTFSETYTKDETHHWKTATCEHTDLTKDFAEHTLVNGVCSVCGYIQPEVPKETYTFIFVGFNCALNNEQTYEAGTAVNLTFNVNEGYHLPETINIVGADSYTYSATNKTLSLTINKNIVVAVNAQKDDEPQVHFIKYILMYLDAPEIETVYVNHGEKATEPDDPVREGYNFYGWWTGEFEEEYEKFDFDKVIEKDYVVYAGWRVKQATINFINSVTEDVISSQTVNYFDKVVKPENPTLTGHNFDNWYKDAEMTELYNFDEELKFETNTINIYGKFDKKSFTVTFDPNGGKLVSDSTIQIKYQETISVDLKPKLERPGYDLSEVTWHLGKEAEAEEFVFGENKITENTTLYAHYIEPTKYQITFKVDRNKYYFDVPEGVVPSPDGIDLKKPSGFDKSYEFKCWDKELVPATEDTTYVAQFDEFTWRLEADTRECMNKYLTYDKLESFKSVKHVGLHTEIYEVEGIKAYYKSINDFTGHVDKEYYDDGTYKFVFDEEKNKWIVGGETCLAAQSARSDLQDSDIIYDDWYGAYSVVEGYVICSSRDFIDSKIAYKFRDGVLYQIEEYNSSSISHEGWLGRLTTQTTISGVGTTTVKIPVIE